MTGAAIVRWPAGDAVVLAVHGAFDGASAWGLRVAMEESAAERFLIDLTPVVEAYDFAASILAQFARQRWRDKRFAFRVGSEEHARILSGHGLEVLEEPATDPTFPAPRPWSPSGSPVVA